MKPARRQQGKSAFDLIEEATHVLRTAPAATWAAYYVGAIPFVLGLLFFWADMSRNPYAGRHLADASFLLALSFLWMKFWQVVFARRIRAQVAATPPMTLDLKGCIRIALTQTILQPSGLFILPLASIPLLPFAWVYAFYQNVTVLADGREHTAALFKKASQQAKLWPKQNHLALAILAGFAFYLFLNWVTVCMTLPQLAKMLFGIESMFTKSPWSLLNTTFFAAVFGLTYLCVDPLLKTVYTLRCFYGESLESGEDLKAELKPFVIAAQKIAVAILILSSVFFSLPARAADAPTDPKTATGVSPPVLDKTINETIHERKYTWRMPREKVPDAEANKGFIVRFFDNVGAMVRKWVRGFIHWLDEWLEKLFRRHHPPSRPESSGWNWIASVQFLLWSLVALVLATLVIFLVRVWQRRRRSPALAVSEAIAPVPDITDENVGADQLPEDGWTRLARELLERGEFRLAMRAFYLASLSHLASRNLIRIARFKSNRDYEHELRRRAHSFPEVVSVFGDNVSVFERIWYGMHEVNPDLVNHFSANVDKIKNAG
jgi:hypothetical protein